MGRCRLSIVIPAFNEEKTIGTVVDELQRYGLVLVVDDGSTDKTPEVLEKSGVCVFRLDTNVGYERALNIGLTEATKLDCDFIITCDADGELLPSNIPEFLRVLNSNDIVVGARAKKNRLSERVSGFFTKLVFDVRDPLCGMKGYKRSVLAECLPFMDSRLIGMDILAIALKKKLLIKEVSVFVTTRRGTSRFGDTFSANLKIYNALRLFFTKVYGK
jgi:glycosyltransferase involved in cell wall biosynthesis